jgi:hypothetical protein
MDWDAPLTSARQSGMTGGGGRGRETAYRRHRTKSEKAKAHRGGAAETRRTAEIETQELSGLHLTGPGLCLVSPLES